MEEETNIEVDNSKIEEILKNDCQRAGRVF